MALGGGSFTTQNKDLPGAYINFISKASATATLSDRGIATMPLELDWGVDGDVFEVSNADFQKNSMKIFGYDYTSDKLILSILVYTFSSRMFDLCYLLQ
jgi:hypothetical protein